MKVEYFGKPEDDGDKEIEVLKADLMRAHCRIGSPETKPRCRIRKEERDVDREGAGSESGELSRDHY
jgi:hypothetical protein